MVNKYITPEGKKHLLEVGFLHNDDTNNFNFLALGVDGSNAVNNNGEGFAEANGNNYQRVQLTQESTGEESDQSIAISGIFDSTNFNPSEGITINEIAIVNQDIANNEDVFFAYLSAPEIPKKTNVSLKYTIIISIE